MPAFAPASPSPRSLRREPLSTPGGTLMLSWCVRRCTPEPSQLGHGFAMIVPCPLQWPHVLAIEKKPCWKRTCPEPRHCGQVRGEVPGLAPRPRHVSQVDRRGTAIVFSHPKAASSKLKIGRASCRERG